MLTFTIDWILVAQLVLSTILPLLVAIVQTRVTRPGVKAVTLALLVLVTTVLTQIVDAVVNGTALDVGQALLLALGSFVIAVALHYGLWKPTGVAAAVQASVGRTE